MIIDAILSRGCIVGLLVLVSYNHHPNNYHLATLLLSYHLHHCHTAPSTAGFLSPLSHHLCHCDLRLNHQAVANNGKKKNRTQSSWLSFVHKKCDKMKNFMTIGKIFQKSSNWEVVNICSISRLEATSCQSGLVYFHSGSPQTEKNDKDKLTNQ